MIIYHAFWPILEARAEILAIVSLHFGKFMAPNFCYKIIWPLGRIEDIIESWSLFICKSALPTQYLYPLVFLLLLIAVTVLHYKGASINFVHQMKLNLKWQTFHDGIHQFSCNLLYKTTENEKKANLTDQTF